MLGGKMKDADKGCVLRPVDASNAFVAGAGPVPSWGSLLHSSPPSWIWGRVIGKGDGKG